MLSRLTPLLILLAATFAVYSQVLGYGFILKWDDVPYVIDNPAITSISYANICLTFTSFYVGNYAPIHILSYMLDYVFWGLNPHGYHLTNVFLHSLNGIAFYLILVRCSGKKLWSLAAALLFIVHPVQVESVSWISERKNLLSMLFFLTAFYAWQNYREQKSIFWHMFSLITFVMALLTKSVTVIFPVVLLVYDIVFTPTEKRMQLLKAKVPFFIMALFFGLVAIKSQPSSAFPGGTLWTTFLTMPTVLLRYLRLIIWPHQLSAVYYVPIKTIIDSEVLVGFVLIFILTVVAILLWKRCKNAFFCYILFFLGLAPVSQIIPMVTPMHDRYLYFPMLGAAPLLMWPLFAQNVYTKYRTVALSSLLGAILLAAIFARHRTDVWQEASTLWTNAAYVSPAQPFVWEKILEIYLQNQNLEDIPPDLVNRKEFRRSLEKPILRYLEQGDIFNANLALNQMIVAFPGFTEVSYLEGLISLAEGKSNRAEEEFWHALTIDPKYSKAYFALGNIELERNNFESAASFYAKSEASGGPVSRIAVNQAVTSAMSGNSDGAKRHLNRAIQAGVKSCDTFESASEFKSINNRPEFQLLLSECHERNMVHK
jgi:hypothetical protein